ncbi:MAG: SRPBCC family protein [Anaerolineales bacterium]|nr:SRPBCC family protein [Anaerolineales bacterium]
MKTVRVESTRLINAPVQTIYEILADFEDAHVAILPRQYFRAIKLLSGGQGAGTIYQLQMVVSGQTYDYEMHVSEPVPGRELLEVSSDGAVRTVMRVEPAGANTQSQVTIISDFTSEPGFMGWLQRLFQPAIVRRIYREELDNLAQYAATH